MLTLLEGYSYVPKEVNSDEDFITIECQEHGLYYAKVKDIKRQNIDCPRCQFLKPSRMHEILEKAKKEIDKMDASGDWWLSFWKQNKHQPEIFELPGLYYKLHITHKETGFQFQKIGILSELDEKSTGDLFKDFDNMWNPYKWKKFKIEVVDKIECSLLEAHAIEALYQKENAKLKITVPNYLGFSTNKTYEPDFIWQAKSKTVQPLRDAYLLRQKGECTICGKPVVNPTLDHMHIKKVRGTGYMRAVCCSQCNTFLARSENNAARHNISNDELPDVLRRMADHLENQKMVIHPTEVPKRKKVGVREWNKVRKYYFKVYPRRKTLPEKPTYVNEQWLKWKKDVDAFIENEIANKKRRKRK